MATRSSAAAAARPSLTINRRIKATPAKVWSAWTDPEKMIGWFGRADAVPGSMKANIDARVGGRFRVSFTAMDGEYFEVGGIYREVVPNERLVFSWAWHSTPERESQVMVLLRPDGDGTLLTLHHEQLFDQAARDGHERGWLALLERLEELVA